MMTDEVKTDDNDSKIESQEQHPDTFYDNIERFHSKVWKINKLIRDYFSDVSQPCNKEYMAIKIKNGEITDTTHDLDRDTSALIIGWFLDEEHNKDIYDDTIKTLEFNNNVFFCKVFSFANDAAVLAGYVLEDGIFVRTFLSKLSEQILREQYERILQIL